MIGRPVHSPWSFVLRYVHANALPVVESIHEAPSPAFTAAGKLKAGYPEHRVTVRADGQEWEIGR